MTIPGLQVAALRFASYLLPNLRGKYCALIDIRSSQRLGTHFIAVNAMKFLGQITEAREL